ncbi:MAG: site-specific DNA-methyltransferase [Chitinophagales bacterium]|jgi:site-specific DNA-methyltransferase (adenine-specific)|nr:site-specific DNA-methyltransferase [Sphingobacteriales bacterium]MBP9142433.1 site-specific DNA-methyltransferase [Chitinophagales bacterium]MDA0200075.1 site-specific DNA-methyltransferase [Bacteroidota bacterium]MBK8678000.1 site-specific DNA-methyltransferase [Sphingobacteriales bacterium]MBL0247121.1 site-specific DNA-methyltransferase [Sphingobacteriales bacterium]
METNKIYHGNCVEKLKEIEANKVDLIYFDPPFFTQRKHSLTNKDNSKTYEFDDKYNSIEEYLELVEDVLKQSKRVLKNTGSVFLHCDKTASHNIRVVMDKIFGRENFQSEIIWSYKRWSNAKKGLLNAHQVIFFYSKSQDFKFNTLYTDYSVTTNLDQILQDRARDENGKSVYKKDENGNVILGKEKKGVPLSDVWEIPYLNPKAKERIGYPTQKPVLLLNQILNIVTDEGDLVVDPFCGSGTTCVSAKSLNRQFIGIDISKDAVELANSRLEEMVISESNLLNKGTNEYQEKTEKELAILKNINAFPVQRNSGIDGFLKDHFEGMPVPVKIQGEYETIEDAIEKLEKASYDKDYKKKILIQTRETGISRLFGFESDVTIMKSLELQTKDLLKKNNEGITASLQKSGFNG